MPKMIILRGLPASGKSTWRREYIKENPNTVFVNKDDLRELYPFDSEKEIHEECINIIKMYLADGKDIIIDNTNLNQRTVNQYTSLAYDAGYEWEIKDFNTDLQTCLDRNRDRGRTVPRSVIIRMAMDSGRYNRPKENAVVFDLDGTLCDISHRKHFVTDLPEGQKKDWDSFFNNISGDKPNPAVKELFHLIKAGGFALSGSLAPKIIFVSGRPERYRKATEEWLENNGFHHWEFLFMRPDGDKRDDNLVKQRIYDKYLKPYFNILFAVDDRDRVVKMWRDNGITCFQCAPGDF